MNNQYEIELEGINDDIESYYVDQSIYCTKVDYGKDLVSAFTPYGIKCLDSEYSKLIRNINEKVKRIYLINRKKSQCSDIKTRELFIFYNYYTWYDLVELSNDRLNKIRIEWENGFIYDFMYVTIPNFDLVTRKTNPELLRKEVKENPHLHNKIKENLLLNLDNYLKMK